MKISLFIIYSLEEEILSEITIDIYVSLTLSSLQRIYLFSKVFLMLLYI